MLLINANVKGCQCKDVNTNENDIELTNLTALDLADHINDMIYNIK